MSAINFPRRAVHLDFHTLPAVYDVGRDFDADAFAHTLERAGVDYITVFAKCNLGFAYYPTKVGVVHPGLQRELLGPMVDACHRCGIRAAAYLNTGLDHEQALRHREWCKVNARGQVYEMETKGNFFRRMCLNTGWEDVHLAMIAEVLERYEVDGLFLDCFTLDPCYGVECLDGMRAEGLDYTDPVQAAEYCWRVTQRFCTRVQELVDRLRPGIYLYFNGLPYRSEPTHLELEVLPTGGWGYDYLHWSMRYARTLNKPWFTMTGRFHQSWGDFGGLRPDESLAYDCLNSLANAGSVSVGDHMHPRGPLEPAVYLSIGRVYERVRTLEPWTYGARALAEIAIVDPSVARIPPAPFRMDSVAGASRMLMELKHQFDVCDAAADLTPYRLLILPDDVAVDDALAEKLQAHLARGGGIISSAWAGLNPARTAFCLEGWGLDYLGNEPNDPAFFTTEAAVAAGIPGMPLAIYTPGAAFSSQPGTEVLAHLWKPYFNRSAWDGYHDPYYTPPEADTGRPAVAQHGRIIHFSFPVFRAYFNDAVVAYKTLLANCLARLLPDPMLTVDGLPSFGQATVTALASRRMVHLLTYVPELRGRKLQIIEEPITVRGVSLTLRVGDFTVREVYLAPTREALPFTQDGGVVRVTVPEVTGHTLVVCEGE